MALDKATGELVERSTYQAYGGAESSYRPDKWGNFREDYGFTGKESDVEVGLTYFGKRFYNALLQRWVSPDPLEVHSPGEADANLYAYVSGQALKNVDPLGLQQQEPNTQADAGQVAAEGAGSEIGERWGEAAFKHAERIEDLQSELDARNSALNGSAGDFAVADAIAQEWGIYGKSSETLKSEIAAENQSWASESGKYSQQVASHPAYGSGEHESAFSRGVLVGLSNGATRAAVGQFAQNQVRDLLVGAALAGAVRAAEAIVAARQNAQLIRNVLQVSMAGGPVGPAARAAKPVTGLLSDVTVVLGRKVVGRGTVDLRGTLEGIKSGKIGPRDVFQNREGLLPAKSGGYYQEFLHPTPGVQGAGSQRIIQGQGGELFYTPDHYKSFIPLN